MNTEQWRDDLDGKDPETVLRLMWERFGKSLVFATSLSAEDQIVTEIIVRNKWPIPFVTLDTGRLFPETYALLARSSSDISSAPHAQPLDPQ